MGALRPTRLAVGTSNPGKLVELRALLSFLPVHVEDASELLGRPLRVIEDGETFAENATKKALAMSKATGLLSLADDSGLEVDALAGRPGVQSARFAGEGASDAENNAALVAALCAAGVASSRARFRCVLALVRSRAESRDSRERTDGGAPRLWVVEGVCEGSVRGTPQGSGGFGYDPLFRVDGSERTLAECAPDEKNRVSHRARAFAQLRDILVAVLARPEER